MCTHRRSRIAGFVLGLVSRGIVPALAAVVLSLSSCQAVGLVASKLPQPPVAAAYAGLKNQKVGILVWADHGIVTDQPTLEIDLARQINQKLQQAEDSKAAPEVEGMQLLKPELLARFEEDHPELDGEDIVKIAPRLPPMNQLVYIEITGFSLHPNDSADLWRGSISANVRVLEIKDGKAEVKFRENGVSILYPLKSPDEGQPGLDPAELYQQSVDEMSKEVAIRFITHDADTE